MHRRSDLGDNNTCVGAVDSKADRLDWEKKLVSTLAQLTEDRISKDWLGNSSPIEKIRRYGLWQVNGLLGTPLKERDLDEIEEIVVL